MLASGDLSAVELTEAYLRRIDRLDPVLHSVIETNPAALDIAARRDAERRAGRVRGPLHGIAVLVKDNIATNDAMETTAGSLALVGSRVPRDATVVARLRAAGAVILGKANLSAHRPESTDDARPARGGAMSSLNDIETVPVIDVWGETVRARRIEGERITLALVELAADFDRARASPRERAAGHGRHRRHHVHDR